MLASHCDQCQKMIDAASPGDLTPILEGRDKLLSAHEWSISLVDDEAKRIEDLRPEEHGKLKVLIADFRGLGS